MQSIERDKLYHFVLADSQPNPVLVIKSPSDNKAQKRFLGYEWSSAKGNEGIKLDKDARGHHQTMLYDETRRDNPEKLCTYIAANFDGTALEIPANLSEFSISIPLVEMLDFSRLTFEKQISLVTKKSIEIQTKWPLYRLTELVEIISGGTPDTGNTDYWDGDIPWLSVADFSKVTRFVETAEKSITELGLKNSSTKLLQPGDIIISARGTVGAMAQLRKPMAFNQSCYGLRANNKTSNDYIFYVFKREIRQLKEQAWGSKFDAITMKSLNEVKIPLPPFEVQQKVADECDSLDKSIASILAEGITLANLSEEVKRRKENVFKKYL